MADEYTPDTDAVREAWLWHQKAEDKSGLLWGDHNDQFNRWLTEHDAKVQAELEAELAAVRATVDRARALARGKHRTNCGDEFTSGYCLGCDLLDTLDGGGSDG